MRTITLTLLLVLAAALCATAQGTYTQIDVPGSLFTDIRGINGHGDMSGNYADSNGVYHGFVFTGGTYISVDYPGAIGHTGLFGLNDSDTIVGQTVTAPFIYFVYNVARRTFTDLTCPTAINTAIGINNAGVVVGSVSGSSGNIRGLEISATCRKVGPKNSQFTYLSGISDNGKAIGMTLDAERNITNNVVYFNGVFTPLHLNTPGGGVIGINPNGDAVVGGYVPSSGIGSSGFVYQNGTFTTLQFPGSVFTTAEAINAQGVVAGSFQLPDDTVHGFLWAPPAPKGH